MSEQRSTAVAPPTSRRFTFLVVDDSRTARSIIEKSLRLGSLPVRQIFHCSNGAEALDVLAHRWVDVVLTDLNMPGMNGADLVEAVASRTGTAPIPFVLITSHADGARIDKLRALGVAACLRKPFAPEELATVVRQVVRSMADQRRQRFEQVLRRVLADFAFTVTELHETVEDLVDWQPEMGVQMEIAADHPLLLEIGASRVLATMLAANVLGVDADSELAKEQAFDALAELANVTSSHVRDAMTTDAAPSDALPEPLAAGGPSANAEDTIVVQLLVGEETLTARLTW